MQCVGEFEKVSFVQFEAGLTYSDAAFIEKNEAQNFYDMLQLPERATKGSAGYDFKAPFPFSLCSGETITIPTGVRVRIDDGWFLGVLPRSGHGFKYRIQLDNTMGIIDSDFYYSEGEGHIMIKITNDGKVGKTLHIKAGDGFAQGIFLPHGITYSDRAQGVRLGGMGSTDEPVL